MVPNPPPGPDGQAMRMVGLDCAIIMNPKVWVASGHVGGFADQMMDCAKCKKRFRADKLWLVADYDTVEIADEVVRVVRDLSALPEDLQNASGEEILPYIQQLKA